MSLTVCMISDDFLPAATGVGIHVQLISRELARRGHKVTVLTSRRPGENEVEIWEGVTVYRTFTLKVAGFYQALPSRARIRRILEEVKPDLVHHHYLGILMKRAHAVAGELGLNQMYTYHMTVDHLTQPLFMRPLRGFISRQIVDYCNRFRLVLCPSDNLAKQLPSTGIRTPVRFITNPVVFDDPQTVTPAERGPAFTVFFAGRLEPEKNVPYLFRAFQQLTRSLPDAKLWIAGRGSQRETLGRLAAELGIDGHVSFLGFLDHPQLAAHYAACDVFVLPSLVETQGMVAMEAMWFGKPAIVTSSIVSATELVQHEVNGYIVDPDAVEDLTGRLTALAADGDLRQRMGLAARRHAEAYQPQTVVDAIELAYGTVLRRG